MLPLNFNGSASTVLKVANYPPPKDFTHPGFFPPRPPHVSQLLQEGSFISSRGLGGNLALNSAASVLNSMMRSGSQPLVQQQLQQMQYQQYNQMQRKALLPASVSPQPSFVNISARMSNEYSYSNDMQSNFSSQAGKSTSSLYAREYSKSTRGSQSQRYDRMHAVDTDEMNVSSSAVVKTSSGRTSINSLRSSYGISRISDVEPYKDPSEDLLVTTSAGVSASGNGVGSLLLNSAPFAISSNYNEESDDSSDKWHNERAVSKKTATKQSKKSGKAPKSKRVETQTGGEQPAQAGGVSNPPVLPVWLSATGDKQHSEKQLQSGVDLSRTKKKYRMSLCIYCAKFCPSSPWATMKSRKYEHEIFKKHEKSFSHVSAAQMYTTTPAIGTEVSSAFPTLSLATSQLTSVTASVAPPRPPAPPVPASQTKVLVENMTPITVMVPGTNTDLANQIHSVPASACSSSTGPLVPPPPAGFIVSSSFISSHPGASVPPAPTDSAMETIDPALS